MHVLIDQANSESSGLWNRAEHAIPANLGGANEQASG
jgi:hypothetical protein